MKPEYMYKVISTELAKLKVQIDAENSLNLHDKNIFLEDIMANILNIIYDLSLINTNLNINNYPAIDLKDETNKIAIQVTTNVNRDKIIKTLDVFFEKKYDNTFKNLYIVVFDNHSYRKEFATPPGFTFTIKDNIITYNKLLNIIKNVSPEKLEKIYNYILISLKENIYNVDWTIRISSKALNNLGKRYNRKLNVYNSEAKKIEMFLLNNKCENEIQQIINKLITLIENNDINVNIKMEDIIDNFNKEYLNSLILKFETFREKVIKSYENSTDEYNKIYNFENEYINLISELKKLVSNYFAKIMICKGVAGIGKSHTLAYFLNEHYIKLKKPGLLILGQEFSNGENIENQILNIMQGNSSFSDMLSNLNSLGIIRNINIPIIIDGINESTDRSIWKKGLNNLIEEIIKYSNLKLVLSIRDTYYNFCIPEEIEKNTLALVSTHEGLDTNNIKAIKEFFDFYEIKMPIFQIINNEFNNPLFLTIYCEMIKKYNIDINEYDYRNFIEIYITYLTKINDIFVEKFVILTLPNIIDEIINKYIEKQILLKKKLSNQEFMELLSPISNLYNIRNIDVLNFLIENGLFYIENYVHGESIAFTYERYEKISTAIYLIKDIKDVEKLKYELNEGFLKKYIEPSDCFDNGVLEELINLIQLKYCVDFMELIDFKKINFDYYIKKNYINSLIWFKGEYNKDVILKNVNMLYETDDFSNQIIDIFIKMSYLENNPLNVEVVNNYLKTLDLPLLDYYWSIPIDDYYTNYNKNSIDNIINYCLNFGNNHLNENTIYLIAQLLSWFLSSSNRYLRDISTKALTKILLNSHNTSIKLLDNFKNTKDMYILERVISAIYGSVVRSVNNENINELSEKLFSTIYRNNDVIDNIIIKIYSKKYFKFVKEKYNINLYYKINDEKKSKWYSYLPTNEDIDKYEFNIEECHDDKRKYANSTIIKSMVTEYGRGISCYGDFGRYTLQPFLRPFEYIFKDIQLLANIATKRIFDYGYDYKLFGDYDLAVKKFQSRHDHVIERIGKKYQWIASYELLSKLYDNFKPHYYFYDDDTIDFNVRDYFDENHIKTLNKNKIRYVSYDLEEEPNSLISIDTTNFILKQKYDVLYKELPGFDCSSEEEYSKYIIKEINGKKYLNLFNLYSQQDRKYDLKNVDKNILTIVCTAIIFKDIKKLNNSQFKSYSQGKYNEIFNVQLYDIPYSSEYLLEYNRKTKEQNASKNFATCYDEYIWEGVYDESISGCIKVITPQKWIIDKFNLEQKQEGKWYKNDKLICIHSNIYDGNKELLIEYDTFIGYLKENKLKICWTIYCEKCTNNNHFCWRVNLYYDYKKQKFTKETYDKDNWETKSLF